MLAGGNGLPHDTDAYLFEPKWDGVRTVVRVGDDVTLISRRGTDVSPAYPELAAFGDALAPRRAVLDGEVVAFSESGRASFQRLQRRMHVRSPSARLMAEIPVTLMVFDLLWVDGESLLDLPQTERRRRLEELGIEGPHWHTSPLLTILPDEHLLEACREAGLEGYMAKRKDARYQPGKRSAAWSKVKCVRRREMVVGGWAPGHGARQGSIGSLAVGPWELAGENARPSRLRYLGQVGSGLSEAIIGQLEHVFERYRARQSPFSNPVPRAVRFVQPVLVAEVAYTEVTEGGTLRQPSVVGFRTDLDPADVVLDEEIALPRAPA